MIKTYVLNNFLWFSEGIPGPGPSCLKILWGLEAKQRYSDYFSQGIGCETILL